MKITIKSILSLLMLGSTLSLIPACGGGGGGGAAAGSWENGPTLLFPDKVDSGEIVISGLTLKLVGYTGTDNYASYQAQLSQSENSTIEDSGTFVQDIESRAGRLVFHLKSNVSDDKEKAQHPYLEGRLVITIAPAGMQDATQSRTGTVENTSELYLFTPPNKEGQMLQLQGSPAIITWGGSKQESAPGEEG